MKRPQEQKPKTSPQVLTLDRPLGKVKPGDTFKNNGDLGGRQLRASWLLWENRKPTPRPVLHQRKEGKMIFSRRKKKKTQNYPTKDTELNSICSWS